MIVHGARWGSGVGVAGPRVSMTRLGLALSCGGQRLGRAGGPGSRSCRAEPRVVSETLRRNVRCSARLRSVKAPLDPPRRPFPSESGGVTVRRMRPADLPRVVREHRANFPDGFFARLGPAFLTAYYRAYAFGDAALSYVAEADGRVVGYLVGVVDPARHRRDLLGRHRRSLMLRGILGMAIRPGLATHFLSTRATRYGRRLLGRRFDRSSATSAPPGRVAILSHVAVATDHQSRGLGSALVERFLDDARAAGCEAVTLVTLSGTEGAGSFYRHRGWQDCGEHADVDGRRLTTYEWRFARPGAAQDPA